MAEPKTYPMFAAIDSNGDYSVGKDSDEAVENYNNEWGALSPLRVIQVNLTARPPGVTEASVTVPDEAGQTVEVQS
jgi:hypothetical protein